MDNLGRRPGQGRAPLDEGAQPPPYAHARPTPHPVRQEKAKGGFFKDGSETEFKTAAKRLYKRAPPPNAAAKAALASLDALDTYKPK